MHRLHPSFSPHCPHPRLHPQADGPVRPGGGPGAPGRGDPAGQRGGRGGGLRGGADRQDQGLPRGGLGRLRRQGGLPQGAGLRPDHQLQDRGLSGPGAEGGGAGRIRLLL